jgi:hypothetical protein
MTSSQGDFTIDVIEGDMSSRALKKMKKLRAKIKPPMSAWSCYVSKIDGSFFLQSDGDAILTIFSFFCVRVFFCRVFYWTRVTFSPAKHNGAGSPSSQ